MIDMIKRRTLLAALPLLFASACARAQGSQQSSAKTSDMPAMSGQALSELTGGAGKIVWLALVGTVRLSAGNANVRPATLKRALKLNSDGTSAQLFDIWQIGAEAAVTGPSVTSGASQSATGPNDAGVDSVWLDRAFSHTALRAPIEISRLSRANARVIAIDATQIWLLEGGLSANSPALTGADLAAFDAWRVA